jgi:hypothetical protein
MIQNKKNPKDLTDRFASSLQLPNPKQIKQSNNSHILQEVNMSLGVHNDTVRVQLYEKVMDLFFGERLSIIFVGLCDECSDWKGLCIAVCFECCMNCLL